MTQWEYRNTPTLGTDLASMGMDGWELVCVDASNMHFKRPIEPVAAVVEEPAAEAATTGSRRAKAQPAEETAEVQEPVA